jgi:hypothetical protein
LSKNIRDRRRGFKEKNQPEPNTPEGRPGVIFQSTENNFTEKIPLPQN